MVSHFEDSNDVVFKSWIKAEEDGRICLENISKCVEDFVELFLKDLHFLKLHDYVSKEQSQFFSNLKSTIEEGEVIIGGDFAENYAPVIQDAIQSAHWSKILVTIHPWIIYYKEGQELKSLSMAVISDNLIHDPAAVHVFQKTIITHLQSLEIPMQKIHYFREVIKSCNIFVLENEHYMLHKQREGVPPLLSNF